MSLLRAGLDVLRSTISEKTRSILVQVGDVLQDLAETDGVELWQTFGLVSRPPKAQAGKSAGQVVTMSAGDRDVAVAARDLRGQELSGRMKEGETCLYAAGEFGTAQGRVMLKQDGSITQYTTASNEPGGEAVFLKVSPEGLEFVAPWGTLKFNETGFHVRHKSGSRLDLGGIGGLPDPLSALGSYAVLSAAITKVEGAPVLIGPRGGNFQPATFGFYEVPLTNPLATAATGILTTAPGAPIGLFTSQNVRIAR
jgi:hypothetical protein